MRIRIFVVLLTVTTACTSQIGHMSVLSTKRVHLPVNGIKRASGRDCRWNVLGIPFGAPSLESATEEALRSDPGAQVIIDAKVTQSFWWFLIGKKCVKVTGTLAKQKVAAP